MRQNWDSPFAQQRWIEAKNVGSVKVPGCGVVEVVGATQDVPGRVYLHVQRPTGTEIETDSTAADITNGQYLVAVNSTLPIAADGFGLVTLDFPAMCLYDTGDGDPEDPDGKDWGTEAGSFELHYGSPGFASIGGADAARGIAVFQKQPLTVKPYIDFALAEDLDTSDQFVTATIVEEYGPGRPGIAAAAGINVYNLETSVANTYVFSAASGKQGRAAHWESNKYIILNLECP